MRLWAEVFDAAGNRLGDGMITSLQNVSVRRVLDGVGRITLSVPGTDERAVDLLTNERRVRVYLVEGNTDIDYQKRLLGSGIIRNRTASDKSAGWTLSISAADDLDELKRVSTMLGLEYNSGTNSPVGDWSIADIVDDLMVQVGGGWTASTSATGNHYVRFDGVNILQAVGAICQEKGLHFRLGTSAKTLEVGAFGVSNGLSLVQATRHSIDLHSNDDVALIETIRIEEDSENVVNRIVALGAGAGETRLTLEASTRSVAGGYAYDIVAGSRHGRAIYYIEDTASQALYGVIEKVLVFDQIQIQSNSDADIETASNALYDVAVAHLNRHKVAQQSYSLEVRKAHKTIRPGDKVHVVYKGFIERTLPDGSIELLPPVDINEEFWVMEVTENVNLQGVKTSMKVSNLDRHMLDAARIIVGQLEKIRIKDLMIQPYTSHWGFAYKKEIDATHTATIPLDITDRTLRLRQVLLRLQSTPFRATATGAASGGASSQTSSGGGDHNHRMFVLGNITGFPSTADKPYWARNSSGGSLLGFKLPSAGDLDVWTESSSGAHTHSVTIPAHTHAMNYGIYDDTQYPAGITIAINGVDRTSALGGAWGTISTGVNVVVDITEYIANAAGGLQQLHSITIGCASGRGIAQGILEIYEDIQNLG